ncbi:MAG: Ig-like domain-containing protein [Butyrivibrio sp.]|nr:Ig-like domain-containing protein [Muribaculum sp.]MCM1552194.1 Ig-like domain-containing protein [Butyrivibrio sp.]
MKKKLSLLLTLCLLVASCPLQVFAETVESTEAYESTCEYAPEEIMTQSLFYSVRDMATDEPNQDGELILYGDACKLDEGIELTDLAEWRSGSVWYAHQISAESGFTINFSYWAGGGRSAAFGGADGIVLTLSEETGLGEEGGSIGFVGGDAYGIELDSYYGNLGDPNGKHIAIIHNSTQKHIAYALDDRVDDSQWHNLTICYEDSHMSVLLDDEEVLTHDGVELPDKFYLGISAATGAGMNRHLIKDFTLEGIVSEGESFEEDNHPVVIVLGCMGSRLFNKNTKFDDTTVIWDPPISIDGENAIHKLGENMAIDNELYVRPCENQNSSDEGFEREYGAAGEYQKLVDGLCEALPDREIYVFSYDWRKSNEESADKLNEFLTSSVLEGKTVDIVCHSMGGMVTSSYYSRYGDNEQVDKIIICGTPFEGAPKLINAVLTKEILDDYRDTFIELAGMVKKVKASYPALAEVTPTEHYISETPMQKDGILPFNLGDYDLSYDEYVDICKEIFGEENYTNAQDFQKSLLSGDYNALLDYDKAFFMIGVNQKTITAVKFNHNNNDINEKLYESDLEYTNLGDGTVPYLSASIMEQVKELDAKYWINFDTDHMGLVKEEKCVEWVSDILKFGYSSVKGDEPEPKAYTVIRIACPVDVTMSNGAETLCSDANSLSVESSFGRLDIIGENDEIKMLCVDSGDMDVTLNGTGTGVMDYTIRFYDSNENLMEERVFEDVPITEDTLIYTNITESQNTVLEIDQDGDGTIDATWTAAENEWVSVPDSERIPIERLELDLSGGALLECGEQASVSVVKYPLNATDNVALLFASSDENVLTVNAEGLVSAVSEGDAVITAKASNGMEASLKVSVRDHKHNYEPYFEWTDDNQSCKVIFTCSGCQDIQTMDAEVSIMTTPATCTEDGMIKYSASVVYEDTIYEADEKTEVIPAEGHSYMDTVIAPTETEQGYTEHICEKCNDTYYDNYVDPIASELPEQVIICNENITKQVGDCDFWLCAVNQSVPCAKMSYISSDINVITVSGKGKVRIIGEGTATIKIKAPAVDGKFRETEKQVNITVRKRPRVDIYEWIWHIIDRIFNF